MTRTIGLPCSLEEMEAMARTAMARLPQAFRDRMHDIVFEVQDFATEEVLDDLGIDNPFALTGLYEGEALTERSIEHSGRMPPRVFLYRRPILDEWAERGDETLEHLVAHVMIHEIGHHFGLSDDDMHALEDMV